MATPKDVWIGMDKNHKYFIASVIATIAVWWGFYGKSSYKTKGMR